MRHRASAAVAVATPTEVSGARMGCRGSTLIEVMVVLSLTFVVGGPTLALLAWTAQTERKISTAAWRQLRHAYLRERLLLDRGDRPLQCEQVADGCTWGWMVQEVADASNVSTPVSWRVRHSWQRTASGYRWQRSAADSGTTCTWGTDSDLTPPTELVVSDWRGVAAGAGIYLATPGWGALELEPESVSPLALPAATTLPEALRGWGVVRSGAGVRAGRLLHPGLWFRAPPREGLASEPALYLRFPPRNRARIGALGWRF